MWNRLTIKWQLIFFMTLIAFLVESAILYTVYTIQNRQSKEAAIMQATAIAKSLNDDFIKISFEDLEAPADMTKKLSAFEDIQGVLYIDTKGVSRYQYGDITTILELQKSITLENRLSKNGRLYLRVNLEDDGVSYGHLLIDTTLALHAKRVDEMLMSILKIFPLALLLGFLVSLFLGESYTRPFKELLDAWRESTSVD